MQILNKIGLIIAFTGLIGMFFFPDILSGYSKAERMGRVKYADTPKRPGHYGIDHAVGRGPTCAVSAVQGTWC